MILLHLINVHKIGDMDKECDSCLKELEEYIGQIITHQFSFSYLLLKSQNFETFHTHKKTNHDDFIIAKISMCVGINHALKGDLMYTLIIQVFQMIPNDILQDLLFKKML